MEELFIQVHVAFQQPKLVEAARTLVQATVKNGQQDRALFFFLVGRSSQCKIAKIKLRDQFWMVFYPSVKTDKNWELKNMWELPMILIWPMLSDMQITRGP